MATVSKWTPFGVALDITATGGTVTRKSATQYTVAINASWETYYSGAQTNYGMTAASGGVTKTLSAFDGTKRSSGSGSFTGTYSISGNGAATKTVSVTFRNFNDDNDDSATKSVSFSVSVPAWTSYTIKYNANGGSGAPGNQTKWKDQTLTLSGTKPTRTGYSFLGWSTSSTATSATYSAGGTYTANSAATLYAVWKANTYTITYNANGGSGAPSIQTKTYGVTLTLSSVIPVRANYAFLGWSTSASANSPTYLAGGNYTANTAATLYAVWELSYKKPTISNLSATRCTSDGTSAEDGTCALLSFKWSTYQEISSIVIDYADTTGSEIGSVTVAESSTNGTVSQIISDHIFDTEKTYTFTITVTDIDSTSRSTSMSGLVFNIDFCKDTSTAIGKPAEQLYDEKGQPTRAFDVNWRSKFRDHVCIGEKIGHLDGKTGILLSNEGYMHLQRSSAQGYHPYIGFLIDDETDTNAVIRLNCNTKNLEFAGASRYMFANHIQFNNNNKSVFGVDPNGVVKECFTPQNGSGNTIVGYDNFVNKSGNTNVYGYDVTIGVSNTTPGNTTYRPYYRKGDSVTLNNHIFLSGYLTNSGTEVYFTIPFAKPVVGNPTVAITSVNGFRLRQNGNYTHGSSASVWVKPDSYTVTLTTSHGIGVKATFSTTTDCVNNAPIGIQWSGTITFS